MSEEMLRETRASRHRGGKRRRNKYRPERSRAAKQEKEWLAASTVDTTHERSVPVPRQEGEESSFRKGRIRFPFWEILLWSLLMALLSVANPFLEHLANAMQSQALYVSFAGAHHMVPHLSYFGMEGTFYYFLLQLTGFLPNGLGLMGLEFIALLLSGSYFFRIAARFTQGEKKSRSYLRWFYLLTGVLGFGGLYASLFVLPVLLMGIWFLVRVVEDDVRDESYLLYGVLSFVSLVIEPVTLLFWMVAGIGLLVHHARLGQKARSFYQFLCALFSFLALTYSFGFYVYDNQLIGFVKDQIVDYGWAIGVEGIKPLLVLGVIFAILIFTGIGQEMIQAIAHWKEMGYGLVRGALLWNLILLSLGFVFLRHLDWSWLVLLLPMGMLVGMAPDDNDKGTSYLRSHHWLPFVGLVLALLYPAWTVWKEWPMQAERKALAAEVAQKTEAGDQIYVWDSQTTIYRKANRLSNARLVSAQPYVNSDANQTTLAFHLGQGKATYIVVNKTIPLPDAVESVLKNSYQQVGDYTNFTLYQKTE